MASCYMAMCFGYSSVSVLGLGLRWPGTAGVPPAGSLGEGVGLINPPISESRILLKL